GRGDRALRDLGQSRANERGCCARFHRRAEGGRTLPGRRVLMARDETSPPSPRTSRGEGAAAPPAPIRTTCPYCGVGCGVLASPDGKGGAAIRGDPEHPANAGRLCSKGSALGETLGLETRLLYPVVDGARTNWAHALDQVARRLQAIKAAHGPGAIAFYLSGQLLT